MLDRGARRPDCSRDEEEAIDLNQTKLMALLIPGAELVLMPGTGHFAMFEQPEEFNRIVLDYLAS